MNFYPFHIGDYASATRHLTWMEDAAYRRLLDVYYVKEGPLPTEKRQVYRLAVASTEEQREAIDTVLEEFFELTDSGYTHMRCEDEIAHAVDKRNKAAQSANTRWSNAKNKGGALPAQSERNANASNEACERIHEACEGNAPNPNPNPNPKVNTRAQAPLPDWLPIEAWNGYVEMRKRIRKQMTPRAQQLVLKSLSDMQAKGLSVAQSLDNSTRNSWVDVYEPKDAPVGGGAPKRGSEEYAALHRNASWWREAGFNSVWSAIAVQCWHDNANQFRDGKRVGVAA